ncbi:hypothetical protein, partial [Pseudomonas sp. 1D4]|uniref:hypothetical protein n=1 Tax=Pseudomonas sp. 1D4 TaxID=1843691 RepID=UPI001C462ACA
VCNNRRKASKVVVTFASTCRKLLCHSHRVTVARRFNRLMAVLLFLSVCLGLEADWRGHNQLVGLRPI